jgi:hypothetical protein
MPPSPLSTKLAVEWAILPDGRAALAFNKQTWLVYEETAATRGQTAQQMITASVVAALGPILVDNYSRSSQDTHITNDPRQPIEKDAIRANLVKLLRRASEHGIDCEGLIYEALDIADVEPT